MYVSCTVNWCTCLCGNAIRYVAANSKSVSPPDFRFFFLFFFPRASLSELHHELTDKEVNDIWDVYDHEGDGVLSKDEVRR